MINQEFIRKTSNVSMYMNVMDVFMLPSLFEGLPIVAVEAQISGLSVFLSDKITREVDSTGEVVFLPLDTHFWVSELQKSYHQDRQERVAVGMKLRGSRFDIDAQVGKLCEYYRNLLLYDCKRL